MSDSDRHEKRDDSSPVSPGRFGAGRPAWPSLHEDPPVPPDGPVASGYPLEVFGQSGTGAAMGDLGGEPGYDGPSDTVGGVEAGDFAVPVGGADVEGAAASVQGAETGAPAEKADLADPPANRRRLVLVLSIIAAVLVIGGGITTFLLMRDSGGGPAAAPPGVVLPSPTATVAPVARTATTPFASALPTTLLQYALASSADDEEWLALNAIEAYTETYTDGAAATVTVQAGQWETPEEAAAVLDALVGALPTAVPADPATADPAAAPAETTVATPGTPAVLLEASVEVGGQSSGSVTVVDAGDGTGVAVWNNGTTVFRITGPAADIRNLYAAYPL